MAWKREGYCCECGECCKGFHLIFEKVISRDLIKYYKIHGVDVFVKKGRTYLHIKLPCKHLDQKTNKCKIYGKGRPIVCMKYPESPKDFIPKECTYKFVKK
jgi:Fe-S-cluster containining protein